MMCTMMDLVEATVHRLTELQADRPVDIKNFLTNSGEACNLVVKLCFIMAV